MTDVDQDSRRVSFAAARSGSAARDPAMPLLYVSLYFKQQRQTHYELLNAVRLSGDWETWLEFFADAVAASATQAATSAKRLLELASDPFSALRACLASRSL